MKDNHTKLVTLIFFLLVSSGSIALAKQSSAHDKSTSVWSGRPPLIVEYIPAVKPLTEPVRVPLKTTQISGDVRSSAYADQLFEVRIYEIRRGSYLEITADMRHLASGPSCETLRIVFPVSGKEWRWFRGLDRSVIMKEGDTLDDTIGARTVLPPDGAFNGKSLSEGGYGDAVGRGTISFYPLCAVGVDNRGAALGIDMELPVVYRLKASPSLGLIAEFDVATSPLTAKFPDRAFFRLCNFEFNPAWGMRAALSHYYSIYPEVFRKRVVREGIWLPFTALRSIPAWEDFGFAYHETSWGSSDVKDGERIPNILSDRGTGVLSFQYTEPWDLQLPISRKNLGYSEITSADVISKEHRSYLDVSTSADKNGLWQMRRLEAPWFKTGWAVSITTNCDPELPGFNRYGYVLKDEIQPALKMNVDGIYFDSMEWNWHHDLNYREDQFAYTDYPLTFSSVVGRPALWNLVSEFEFMKKISDEMHIQGKLAMGNGHGWNPFAASNLDLFGAELSWYSSDEHNADALDFKRAISFQKPIVFLLNEGLNDKAFTEAPYSGYQIYFEKMLAYGFFPSFFSVDAANDPYWRDRKKIENGRPFFKKYIPLIRRIAEAGWEPVTFAVADIKDIRVERFGKTGTLFFTVRNTGTRSVSPVLTLDAAALGIKAGFDAFEMLQNMPLRSKGNRVYLDVPAGRTRVIRID